MKLGDFWIWSEENERLLFAADYLEKCGYNRVKSLELCDFALLPVPTKKYMLDSLGGKFALYGGGEYENGINYMKNEKYFIKQEEISNKMEEYFKKSEKYFHVVQFLVRILMKKKRMI